jgi:hypothetical protein
MLLVGVAGLGGMPLRAVIRKLKFPFLVGCPESVPVLALSVNPGGRAPADTEKIGSGDPLALNV